MSAISKPISFALSSFAAAVLLTSCNGAPGSQGSAVPVAARSAANVAVRSPVAIQRDTRASWISPDVKRASRLLFVSDSGTEDVYIFSLPDLVLKGTITGFSEPQGMCGGTAGTVWVSNTGTDQVFQLSRSGKILATINDTYGYPAGCAVNPVNGDVAVFNIFGFSGAGSVYVYSCPSCTPTELTIPNVSGYNFGGYDPKGDLFVNAGRNSTGLSLLGEVPAGKTEGFLITVSGGRIEFGGFVQWYKPRNELAVADQLCNGTAQACVYRIKISGSKGRVVGHTDLQGPSGGETCDMVQGALDPAGEKNVLGPDYEYCGYRPSAVYRWAFPAGGNPTNSYDFSSPYSVPIGAAVSVR